MKNALESYLDILNIDDMDNKSEEMTVETSDAGITPVEEEEA